MRLARILALFSLLVAAAAAAYGGETVQPGPTQKPMLRGINIAGQIYADGELFPALSAIDYFIAQKKMNFVRLVLGWEKLQPQLSGPLDERQAAEIDKEIRLILALGATVQLEVHSFGRRTIDGAEYIVGESDKVSAGHFADLWRRIAERWKDNERLAFELQNEPHDQDTKILMAVQNAAITAIRDAGARNLIVVSGNDWSHPQWYASRESRESAASIHDPANNLAFTIHHYFDHWSAGETCDVESMSTSKLDDFTRWARATGRRAIVGEFAVCANDIGRAAVTTFLNYIENNADVFLGWAWWAGGGRWPESNIYMLDPYASEWDPLNPDRHVSLGGTGRATTWARPLPERRQMQYLQPYLSSSGGRGDGAPP